MEDWIKYLVCFILGWLVARLYQGNGFSIGGQKIQLELPSFMCTSGINKNHPKCLPSDMCHQKTDPKLKTDDTTDYGADPSIPKNETCAIDLVDGWSGMPAAAIDYLSSFYKSVKDFFNNINAAEGAAGWALAATRGVLLCGVWSGLGSMTAGQEEASGFIIMVAANLNVVFNTWEYLNNEIVRLKRMTDKNFINVYEGGFPIELIGVEHIPGLRSGIQGLWARSPLRGARKNVITVLTAFLDVLTAFIIDILRGVVSIERQYNIVRRIKWREVIRNSNRDAYKHFEDHMG